MAAVARRVEAGRDEKTRRREDVATGRKVEGDKTNADRRRRAGQGQRPDNVLGECKEKRETKKIIKEKENGGG